jgi:GNAT superfamily N-acetyltransferase
MTDFFGFTVNSRTIYAQPLDPEDCVELVEGTLLGWTDSDEEVEIGEYRLFLAELESADLLGFDLAASLDWPETSVYTQLFEAGDFTAMCVRAAGVVPTNRDLLIVDRLLVSPEHRGRQIGLHAISALAQKFGRGRGLVAMKPFPLQHEGSNERSPDGRLRGLPGSIAQATTSLRRHYARLGFTVVKGTKIMVALPETVLFDNVSSD